MFARFVTFTMVAVLAACSSGSSPVAPTASGQTPSPASTGPPTVTLSATGFSPQEIAVSIMAEVIQVLNEGNSTNRE